MACARRSRDCGRVLGESDKLGLQRVIPDSVTPWASKRALLPRHGVGRVTVMYGTLKRTRVETIQYAEVTNT